MCKYDKHIYWARYSKHSHFSLYWSGVLCAAVLVYWNTDVRFDVLTSKVFYWKYILLYFLNESFVDLYIFFFYAKRTVSEKSVFNVKLSSSRSLSKIKVLRRKKNPVKNLQIVFRCGPRKYTASTRFACKSVYLSHPGFLKWFAFTYYTNVSSFKFLRKLSNTCIRLTERHRILPVMAFRVCRSTIP